MHAHVQRIPVRCRHGVAPDLPVVVHQTQVAVIASVNAAILALTRHSYMLYFDVYDCQNKFRSDLDDDVMHNSMISML